MLADYTDAERSAAVATFDARYGEMEQVLWCLSVNSRPGLIAGESSPALEALVWTVKSWWGVQGVRSDTKAQMARALAESATWSPDLFGQVPDFGPESAGFAREHVAELVSRSMSLGVPRREYSLASKVLHWLMPWRVPVYDSFVRGTLGVPASWDHPEAYRKVAEGIFAMARTMTGDYAWIGSLEPSSPLRALDKLTWWVGGGSASPAAEVRDPWQSPAGSASHSLTDGLFPGNCDHAARRDEHPPRGTALPQPRVVTERRRSGWVRGPEPPFWRKCRREGQTIRGRQIRAICIPVPPSGRGPDVRSCR